MEDPVAAPPDPRRQAERDRAVARLLKKGERKASAFLARLGGGQQTEDLWQEVCARAWRSRERVDFRGGKPESWLLKIAFRTFLDHRSARPPALELAAAQDVPTVEPAPETRAAESERWDRLMARLDPQERALLLGFHREGRSIAALSEEHQIPESTIKSRLRRARTRLWAIHQRESRDA